MADVSGPRESGMEAMEPARSDMGEAETMWDASTMRELAKPLLKPNEEKQDEKAPKSVRIRTNTVESAGMRSEAIGEGDSREYAYRRMKSVMNHNGHVLNKGFGGAVPNLSKYGGSAVQPFNLRSLYTRTTGFLVLASMISLPTTLKIMLDLSLTLHEGIFDTDPHARSEARTLLAIMPLACAAVNWFVQHLRRTTFWWEAANPNRDRGWFDPLSFGLCFLTALAIIRSACARGLNEYAANWASYLLEVLLALIMLRLWFWVLDKVDNILKGMVADQEMVNNYKPVHKMQTIVQKITRMGREDKDFVYCFADANTVPAEVLSYVWWVYYIGGKIFGAALALSIVFHATEVAGKVLVGGLVVSTAASGGLVFELSPNTISLLRLSLYKPFYVGDLITLNSTGAMDAPQNSITGFVENITMMYVVVRNFEMKQTWISHKAFNQMVIQNWTRRPTKTVLLNIAISIRCPLKRVELLAAFAKKWITESPEIQQQNYQKCHITKVGNGYNIEIIFFPEIGVSHRSIRQKFLLAFMKGAERLKVPFVPLALMNNFPGEGAAGDIASRVGECTIAPADLDDLMPDPNEVQLKDE